MAIYSHVTIGTNDLPKARRFYDAVLGALGLKRLFDLDDRSGYGDDSPQFLVLKPIERAGDGGPSIPPCLRATPEEPQDLAGYPR